jgi:hypothetical protein
MESATKIISRVYADIDPDIAELLKEEAVIDIHVPFDGTREDSLPTTGIGVCIDIVTGLVIRL